MRRTVCLLMVAALLLLAATPAAADVTDFGGTPQRRFRSDDSDWSRPLKNIVFLNLGPSMAQPLIVGDRLYVLAGDNLWAFSIPKIREAILEVADEDAPEAEQVVMERALLAKASINGGHVSYSHPVYSPENRAIYVGTGRHTLVALDPDTLRILGETEPLGAGTEGDIVAAPLAFPGDKVVVVTREGRVGVIVGTRSGRPAPLAQRIFPPSITSSPVRVGDDVFVLARDGPGYVQKYKVDTLKPVWDYPVTATSYGPLRGTPDAPAVEGNFVYLVDKPGVFVKINADEGKIVWQSYNAATRGFYNSAPSVGDRYVYFNRRGLTDNSDSDGMLVALDKNSGRLCWAMPYMGQGNTSPLYWKQARLVLAGDTLGFISGWYSEMPCMPEELAVFPDIGPVEEWSETWDGVITGKVSAEGLIQAWVTPQRRVSWTHLQGVSSEITIGNGIAVFGITTEVSEGQSSETVVFDTLNNRKLSGYVAVGLTEYARNLTLTNGTASPGAAEPGSPVTLAATAGFTTKNPAATPQTTKVVWRWKGETVWREPPASVTIDPNGQAQVSFTVSAPAAPAVAEVMINPDRSDPRWEDDWNDNRVEIPVGVAACNAPSVRIGALDGEWLVGDTVPITFRVVRDSAGPGGRQPVEVTVTVQGQSQSHTYQLLPGQQASGLVQYVAAEEGPLTFSIRVGGAGACGGASASGSVSVQPWPETTPPPTDLKEGVRMWDWR